jgi:tRNA-specific 2-thiouridylase
VVDADGGAHGHVDAVELVTIGQRRGLGTAGDGAPRYALGVDVATRTVTVGPPEALLVDEQAVGGLTWVDGPVGGSVDAQCTAHGEAHRALLDPVAGVLRWATPQRRVAPGQTVAFYRGDDVLGSATAE